jgi:hypothetical protein
MGPKLLRGSCMRSKRGETVAWLVCDNRSVGERTPTRQGSAAGLVLLHSLRRSEVRARASKQ